MFPTVLALLTTASTCPLAVWMLSEHELVAHLGTGVSLGRWDSTPGVLAGQGRLQQACLGLSCISVVSVGLLCSVSVSVVGGGELVSLNS